MNLRTITTLGVLLAACRSGPEPSDESALRAQARRVHADAIVIDTHSDTTPKFENADWDFTARHETGHMDIPRIREGGLDAIFFSIYMGRTEGDGAAVKTAIRRIDSVHEAVRRWPNDLRLATTAAEVRAAAADGMIAALMGVEGGHIIEDDLRVLRTYHRLGVRYMTLTHSFNTAWADSAGTDRIPEPEHDGLTDFGREIVLEMNRLGMMVDVSHVADSTFWDVLEVSEAPLVASHSSCRAVSDHPRNMSDEMIVAMAERGGVIQINFATGYIDPRKSALAARLRPEVEEIYARYPDDPREARKQRIALYAEHDPGPTPASVVIDHIEHVLTLVGEDHVGLGADWDGVPELPVGLDDCSKLETVTLELLRRGWSEDAVTKVLGGNLLRVMEEVEATGARLRREGYSR